METELFNYELPRELIAAYPAARRDMSRMMMLDGASGETEILPFTDIIRYLGRGDVLCCNNTRVRSGRMYGVKNGAADGARFELLLVEPWGDGDPRRYLALLKPGKRARPGTRVALCDRSGAVNSNGDFFTVIDRRGDDGFGIEFSDGDVGRFERLYGHIPLPPYIDRPDEESDAERYQTVYARHSGAVAAPTAGLHFTQETFAALAGMGVERHELTLHVGPGTFKTVSASDITRHKMHFEEYELSSETAAALNACHARGNRVLAVGTTTVRTLESCAAPDGTLSPRRGRTDIFLYPPYKMRACDMLLTNFHLPKSTLLMLVSCFVDREKLFAAYARAIAEKMRFYSYGDCMLVIPGRKEQSHASHNS